MELNDFYENFQRFIMALAYAQPRILGMFLPIPIFNKAMLPGLLRAGVAVGLGLVVAPALMPQVAGFSVEMGSLGGLILKEVFVGFVMGCLIAIPFWAFEAIGFLVDNQRGASIAATLNPLTGNDSSPMGILFNQAFIVFFFLSGGFWILLELLYESFRIWNVFTWTPTLRPDTAPSLIRQIMGLVSLALLLAAPAIVAMFLAEIGLALVSRFVPQLQVFFMAMPIKSALAVLVLMLYMATLFEYGAQHIGMLRETVPWLDGQWFTPPARPR